MNSFKYIWSMFLVVNLAIFSFAQEATNVLFVVDGSSSMLKKWEKEDKWTIAKETLLEIADSLQQEYPDLQYGLRVYGHQSLPIKSNCEDTELKLEIGDHSMKRLKSKLDEVSPKGITPVAYTLEQVALDFEGREGEKNILILVTDGAESCLGDPCAILEMLIQKQIIVKPIVIGLDIPIASLQAYNCVKDVYNPKTRKEFSEKMLRLVHQSIRFTTLQVHLNSSSGNSVTGLNMNFYEATTGELHYRYYHTMGRSGAPDTMLIDPSHRYFIEVQSIPPVRSDTFRLNAARHNEIELGLDMGKLTILAMNPDGSEKKLTPPIPYMIKRFGHSEYLYSKDLGASQSYLAGSYDIDILTQPPIQLTNVKIEEAEETLLEIDAPGKMILNARFPIHGGIFKTVNNELINIFTFTPNTKQEIIDLQPGIYSLIYRFDHKREMDETQQVKLLIQSNEILEINL